MPFEIDVDSSVFSDSERASLINYGTWLAALESGEIQPTTAGQEHFLEVVAERAEPRHPLQALWMKYKHRKEALALCGEIPHYKLTDKRREWYDDAVYDKGIHFPRRGHRAPR